MQQLVASGRNVTLPVNISPVRGPLQASLVVVPGIFFSFPPCRLLALTHSLCFSVRMSMCVCVRVCVPLLILLVTPGNSGFEDFDTPASFNTSLQQCPSGSGFVESFAVQLHLFLTSSLSHETLDLAPNSSRRRGLRQVPAGVVLSW